MLKLSLTLCTFSVTDLVASLFLTISMLIPTGCSAEDIFTSTDYVAIEVLQEGEIEKIDIMLLMFLMLLC